MIVRVDEIQGQSSSSWEDAVKNAVEQATDKIGDVTGVRVMNMTGTVRGGKIVEYKADVKIAYVVKD